MRREKRQFQRQNTRIHVGNVFLGSINFDQFRYNFESKRTILRNRQMASDPSLAVWVKRSGFIFIHMRCESGIVSAPEIVALPIRTQNWTPFERHDCNCCYAKPRSIISRRHSWRCFENARKNFPDLVLLRSLPFSLNPSATAKLMVNVAVSVSEEVMWKPKWPK